MDDSTEDNVEDVMYDDSFHDYVAARIDAIGVLILRTFSVGDDPELRKLGCDAIERAMRTLPTAKAAAKVLPLR